MTLPPNPYTLRPLRQGSPLAGRSEELQSITYYLGLTAASDSPHLALIGPRGVGKTSLLNAAEKIAQDYSLLSVRINLNEAKVTSVGAFWHDFYSALLLAAGTAGCWGGLSGTIYSGLFTMLHARQRVNLDLAAWQWPVVLASSPAPLDSVVCPDSLVHHDISAAVSALRSLKLNGIAFIVDEADCLASNRALLQMCRNIFQRIDSCSLVLAGTEAVFPALTEVFSPIPRQFHRISVERFRSWPDTQKLVTLPFRILPENQKQILPTRPTIQELHSICAGDPAELQLYCHHMFRQVESGEQNQMTLAPKVFREVAKAYRANSPSNLVTVLDQIDKLADELPPQAAWARGRKLTSEQNSDIRILEKELENRGPLVNSDKETIRSETRAWYRRLHELGVTTSAESMELVGGSVAVGYWKSQIDSKSERAYWIDNDPTSLTHLFVISSFDGAIGSWLYLPTSKDQVTGAESLTFLRGNQPTYADKIGVIGLLAMRSIAKASKLEIVSVCQVTTSYSDRNSIWTLAIGDPAGCKEKAIEWRQALEPVLHSHGIGVTDGAWNSLELPSDLELQKLAYVAQMELSEKSFGPDLDAILRQKAMDDDWSAVEDLASWMVRNRASDDARNNLAYCKLLRGDAVGAHDALSGIDFSRRSQSWVIFQNNRAMSAWLMANKIQARGFILDAWRWIAEAPKEHNFETFCMGVLSADTSRVGSYRHLPADIAVSCNAYRIGAITAEELAAACTRDADGEWFTWLARCDITIPNR